MAAIGELGLERVALALVELFAGIEPEVFTAEVRAFIARARHRKLGVPIPATRYQPMLELLDELGRRDFTVYLVSGGGTEFLRGISAELYGVPPETVVGTQVGYELTRGADGRPVLLRTGDVIGVANEGAAKVTNIQSQLGRRPILAAGNSAGDREMLEWAVSGDGPGLALLLHHDDREREFAYESVSSTLKEHEPITTVADRLGWTVIPA
jgi:phosphoserine phosphatase